MICRFGEFDGTGTVDKILTAAGEERQDLYLALILVFRRRDRTCCLL